MKNKKRNYKKIMLSILTTSIAFCSCDSELHKEQDYSRENFTEDKDEGVTLLPIDIYIGNNYKEKITFIDSFVTNILSNQEEASSFNENKDIVLQKYQLDKIDIDKDSPEIQLLFALTDSEILKAIERNDVKGYMKLLNKKGLFQTEKFKRMMSLMNISNTPTTRIVNKPEPDLGPIAICFLGVAIYVGLATVAETYVMVHYKFAMYGASTREISQLMTDYVTETNVIRLWQLKGDNNHIYDITDNLHNSVVQLTTEVAETCDLTKEEQKTLFEITEGTINPKYKKDTER